MLCLIDFPCHVIWSNIPHVLTIDNYSKLINYWRKDNSYSQWPLVSKIRCLEKRKKSRQTGGFNKLKGKHSGIGRNFNNWRSTPSSRHHYYRNVESGCILLSAIEKRVVEMKKKTRQETFRSWSWTDTRFKFIRATRIYWPWLRFNMSTLEKVGFLKRKEEVEL